MKNLITITALLSIVVLAACKKEEKAAPAKDDFEFTYAYNNASKQYMKNAYWYSTGGRTGIRGNNGLNETIEINWSDDNNTAVGEKIMPPSNGFIFYFNDYAYYRDGVSSRMKITAFDKDKMSGEFSFSVKGANDLITKVSGTFTSISKE